MISRRDQLLSVARAGARVTLHRLRRHSGHPGQGAIQSKVGGALVFSRYGPSDKLVW
jgi:hypothetical protein